MEFSSLAMLIQVTGGGIRVLLYDSYGLSIPGNLSLAHRTKAFWTYFLCVSLCVSLCSFLNFVEQIATHRNLYIPEKLVSYFGRFEIRIRFPMRNINKGRTFYVLL